MSQETPFENIAERRAAWTGQTDSRLERLEDEMERQAKSIGQLRETVREWKARVAAIILIGAPTLATLGFAAKNLPALLGLISAGKP